MKLKEQSAAESAAKIAKEKADAAEAYSKANLYGAKATGAGAPAVKYTALPAAQQKNLQTSSQLVGILSDPTLTENAPGAFGQAWNDTTPGGQGKQGLWDAIRGKTGAGDSQMAIQKAKQLASVLAGSDVNSDGSNAMETKITGRLLEAMKNGGETYKAALVDETNNAINRYTAILQDNPNIDPTIRDARTKDIMTLKTLTSKLSAPPPSAQELENARANQLAQGAGFVRAGGQPNTPPSPWQKYLHQ
jgi:hypothetical protein